ncbi:hypothetical protein [Nonomuraea sp. NPDC049784]|uniref:hypothetical protein n=1 Tax=Nonomuraea sp. NPDC049784 TaxID=3154361 RepID=UPI0033ED15D1
MKGKKGSSAATRKDRAELEARAVRAERAEQRLAGELAELKERHDQEIHALRSALAAAKGQRDEAVNPLLLAAEERIRALSAELLKLRTDHKRIQDDYRKLCNGIMRGALKEGLSAAEARRRIANLSGENFHVRRQDAQEDSVPDSRKAAFDRAMDAKEHNVHNRLIAAGGEVRVNVTPRTDPPTSGSGE